MEYQRNAAVGRSGGREGGGRAGRGIRLSEFQDFSAKARRAAPEFRGGRRAEFFKVLNFRQERFRGVLGCAGMGLA